MRIGVNALLLSAAQSYRNAGISHYIRTLLHALGAYDRTNEYQVFVSNAQAAHDLPRSSQMTIQEARWAAGHPARRISWEQFIAPAQMHHARLDLWHAPMHVLPLWLPCPGIITLHDLAFLRFPEFFQSARQHYQAVLTRRSARRARLVITVSEHTRREAIEFLHLPEERVRVVSPMIGEQFLAAGPPAHLAAFRQQRQVPEHYILFLGTLEPRKNILRLLEAYALLRHTSRLPHQLLLAGGVSGGEGGRYYQSLVRRIHELQIGPYIRFLGYVPEEEKTFWYYGADLFVYPSLYEGFGLPVAEALACGVPVVTTATSSLPEVVGDDATWGVQSALMVAPDDTEHLAYNMQEGIENFTLRQQMQARGPVRARRFAAEVLIERMLQVYQDAVALSCQGRQSSEGQG
jgi:glycosyltransferase involved in cell wall biosynthesis